MLPQFEIICQMHIKTRKLNNSNYKRKINRTQQKNKKKINLTTIKDQMIEKLFLVYPEQWRVSGYCVALLKTTTGPAQQLLLQFSGCTWTQHVAVCQLPFSHHLSLVRRYVDYICRLVKRVRCRWFYLFYLKFKSVLLLNYTRALRTSNVLGG